MHVGEQQQEEDFLILSEPQEAQERVIATARDDTRGFVLHAIGGASNAYD